MGGGGLGLSALAIGFRGDLDLVLEVCRVSRGQGSGSREVRASALRNGDNGNYNLGCRVKGLG